MKITDDMLSAQAAEARELWLQACTPDALPEHPSPENSGVKCAVWCVHKSTLRRQPEPPSCAPHGRCSAAFRCGFVRLRDERRGIPRIAYQYCRARV